jgi:hypothetical protein
MAGGVKKPINVFHLGQLGEPKGVFNARLWFSVISGAFRSKHFQKLIKYDQYSDVEKANIKGNVSSMVLIGSVAGSLL